MACIIYYCNLDYDSLPTSKKRKLANGAADTATFLNYDGSTNNHNTSYHTNYNQPETEPHASPQYGTNSVNKRSTSSGDRGNCAADYSPINYTPDNNSSGNCSSNNRQSNYQTSGSCHSGFSTASEYVPLSDNSYNRQKHPYEPPAARKHKSPRQSLHQEPPTQRVLLDTLKRYFKFDSFRENQLESVNATCAGLDTLILMPTGGGKSICYQLPAILSDGITVVVSPLKSLIADQVQRMRSLNVKTSALYGETSEGDAESIIWDLRQECPEHKLLYVTPEKISASNSLLNIFKSLYERNQLARFVIDEAHCVSMWGSDFRPDYRKLNKLREQYPEVPIMALTATAPPKVRDDILNQLGMSKSRARVFIQSFNRPNLKFEVRTKTKGCLKDICSLIRANFTKQCGIIYCLSRNDCESTASALREQGITSAPYHAGLPDEQRTRVFNAWSRGTFQVVCATIAFGMGIDKSDVRFVIHYSMPKSIEGYYQEAGRAGRDGKFASCILYFSKSDLFRMKSMLNRTGFGRKAEDKTRDHGNLQHMIDYIDNKNECRRSILLRYLGEEFNSSECIRHINTACDNCLHRNNYRTL